jgi:hypothetical protein
LLTPWLSSHWIGLITPVDAGVVVLVSLSAASGCGGKSRTTPTARSATAQLETVCEKGFSESLAIDQRLGKKAVKRSVVARQLVQSAEAGEKLDSAITAKVLALPTTSKTRTVLTYLAHSRSELRAVVRAVRRSESAHKSRDLPRSLVLSFVRANSGCGVVKLTKPVIR